MRDDQTLAKLKELLDAADRDLDAAIARRNADGTDNRMSSLAFHRAKQSLAELKTYLLLHPTILEREDDAGDGKSEMSRTAAKFQAYIRSGSAKCATVPPLKM